MNIRLLSNAIAAILLTALCAVNVVSSPARQGAAKAYEFTDGGIQFTVPAGWSIKSEKDSVKVFPKGGSIQIAFVALTISADIKADEKQSLFDSLSEKAGITDRRLGDYVDNQTMGDMKVAARPFEGKNNGHEVEGVYYLLSSDKFVFIVLVADKSASDALGNEAISIIKSIKKIE